MNRRDWELEDARLPTQEAPIIPVYPADGSPVPARKLIGAQPLAALDLKFVNLSHPDDVRRKKAVRTEIRRHVMKDIGERRRRPRRKETFPQVTPTTSRSETDNYEISQLCGANICTVSPNRGLATLGSFPVNADMRVLELMHFRKSLILCVESPFTSSNNVCSISVNTAPYQAFKTIWITTALSDPGHFM